jgi:hypothetical protein
MGRKRLAEAHYVSNWTSLVGALEGVLRYLGSTLSTSYLMGVTGHAFRIAVTAGGDGMVGGDGPKRVDYERALPLYQSVGREVTYLYTYRSRDPRYDRHRDLIIKRIESSIDKGIPVVAYDLHLPEFGIIKGYDSKARLFAVSTQLSAQYGETLPYAQWPVPGRGDAVHVFLVGKARGADRREAEARALRFAARYMQEGEPALADVAAGFAGWARWLSAFEGDTPVSPSGNALMVQAVLSARSHAARFLREIAPDYGPAAAAAMKQAAAAYDRLAHPLSRLATMFPYPSGGNTESPAVRWEAARYLREALACEHEAVHQLEAALGQL